MKVMCEFKERKDAIVLENWEVFTCLLSDKNNQKCYCTKLQHAAYINTEIHSQWGSGKVLELEVKARYSILNL